MVRPGQSAAPVPLRRPSGAWESTFGPGCTPARSNTLARMSPASPCIRRPVWLPWQGRARYWCPARSKTWWPGRVSGWPNAGRMPSRGFLTNGACSPWSDEGEVWPMARIEAGVLRHGIRTAAWGGGEHSRDPLRGGRLPDDVLGRLDRYILDLCGPTAPHGHGDCRHGGEGRIVQSREGVLDFHHGSRCRADERRSHLLH